MNKSKRMQIPFLNFGWTFILNILILIVTCVTTLLLLINFYEEFLYILILKNMYIVFILNPLMLLYNYIYLIILFNII